MFIFFLLLFLFWFYLTRLLHSFVLCWSEIRNVDFFHSLKIVCEFLLICLKFIEKKCLVRQSWIIKYVALSITDKFKIPNDRKRDNDSIEETHFKQLIEQNQISVYYTSVAKIVSNFLDVVACYCANQKSHLVRIIPLDFFMTHLSLKSIDSSLRQSDDVKSMRSWKHLVSACS